MASAAATIRERVMVAGARIKRVKRVDRAATYAERFSDHAPVVVEYDL